MSTGHRTARTATAGTAPRREPVHRVQSRRSAARGIQRFLDAWPAFLRTISRAPTAAAAAIRTRDGHGKATMTEGDADNLTPGGAAGEGYPILRDHLAASSRPLCAFTWSPLTVGISPPPPKSRQPRHLRRRRPATTTPTDKVGDPNQVGQF